MAFKIILGYDTSYCLSNQGNCYVWGKNEDGELGTSDRKNKDVPTLLTIKIKKYLKYLMVQLLPPMEKLMFGDLIKIYS